MNSKTKYPVTDDQLREIFRQAGLGEFQSARPMSDGMYNNVLAVATDQGEYVIKIAPDPSVRVLTHEAQLLAQELRFIALLRDNGVRVPEVYAGDLSKTILPCDYFIMEKLKGLRLDKMPKRGAAFKPQMEEILDRHHAIRGEGFGYEQMGLEPDWYLALRKMTQALVDDCAAFGRPCRSGEKLLAQIDLHKDILRAVPSVLVNFDLHAMNLIHYDGQLTTIDLERCFWGDWIGDHVMSGRFEAASREERIRYYLLTCYLGVITYTEKYSRYKPWNFFWWLDIVSTWYFFWAKGWPGLKKLNKEDHNHD